MNLVWTARTRRQYSLGINWNGHRSGLGQYELHNQLRTFFRREKSFFFYFPHILHLICFLCLWTFPIPKYILFVSCFQVVCRPLAPRSDDYEQCRLKLAATFLCTTGNQAHCKAAPPYSPAQMQIFHAFRKTMFCGHLYDYQCSFTLAMLGRVICIEVTNLSEHQKCMGVPHVSPTHGTSHTLSSTRCSCFVMV